MVGIKTYYIAGLISCLSINISKRETFVNSFKRLTSGIVAVFFGGFMFYFLGYSLWVATISVLVFLVIVISTKFADGIEPSLILLVHIFEYGTFTWHIIFDQLIILGIAIGVSLILNLIHALYKESDKVIMKNTDKLIIDSLKLIIQKIYDKDIVILDKIEENHLIIKKYYHLIRLIDEDNLWNNKHGMFFYIQTRKYQFRSLRSIAYLLDNTDIDNDFKPFIVNYLQDLVTKISINDFTQTLFCDLNDLNDKLLNWKLPTSADELMKVATELMIIKELKYFIEYKQQFHLKHDNVI